MYVPLIDVKRLIPLEKLFVFFAGSKKIPTQRPAMSGIPVTRVGLQCRDTGDVYSPTLPL